MAWDTDKNIQSFWQLSANQVTQSTYKYQIFQSFYLNQLKTYFTAEDNIKQFLVHMVMLMLQLSRKQLFPLPLAKKNLTCTSILNKLKFYFSAKLDYNAYSNHKKSFEHTETLSCHKLSDNILNISVDWAAPSKIPQAEDEQKLHRKYQ